MSATEWPASRVDAARLGALTRLFDPQARDFGPVGQQLASLVLEAVELLLVGQALRPRPAVPNTRLDLEPFAPFVRAPELDGRSGNRAHAYLRRSLRLTRPDTPLPAIGLLVADATRPLTVSERVKRRIGWPGSHRLYGSPGVSIRLDGAAHLAWLDPRFQIDLLSRLDAFVAANVLVWRDVPRPAMPDTATLWALAAYALTQRDSPTGQGRRARRLRALTDRVVHLLLQRVTYNGDDGPYDRLLLCEIWLRSQTWRNDLRNELERHEVLAALRAKFEADGGTTGDASFADAEQSGTNDETEAAEKEGDSGSQDTAPAERPPVSVTRGQVLAVAEEPPLAWPAAVQRLFSALGSTPDGAG